MFGCVQDLQGTYIWLGIFLSLSLSLSLWVITCKVYLLGLGFYFSLSFLTEKPKVIKKKEEKYERNNS